MKRILNIVTVAVVLFSFASCMKKQEIVYERQPIVEWDWATYNARTAGYPFTLLNRVPTAPGRQVYTGTQSGGASADPALTRTYTDTIRMRVNLVGPQMGTAQTFPVTVNPTFTTAVAGTHYTLVDNSVTIPANSNFGFVRWVTRNPGTPAAGTLPVQLVFEIGGNGTVDVSENYKYLGWIIAQ